MVNSIGIDITPNTKKNRAAHPYTNSPTREKKNKGEGGGVPYIYRQWAFVPVCDTNRDQRGQPWLQQAAKPFGPGWYPGRGPMVHHQPGPVGSVPI